MQTKMTALAKLQRSELKEAFPKVELFSFPNHGVTVGVERTGKTRGRFAVALIGDEETKFRRKVGELMVLQRFAASQALPMRVSESTAYDAEALCFTVA